MAVMEVLMTTLSAWLLASVGLWISGYLTHICRLSYFKKALKMFENIDAELRLVIAGNNDLELDQQYWEALCDEDVHVSGISTKTGSLAEKARVSFPNGGTH